MFVRHRAAGYPARGERYADPAGVAELVRRARLKIGWPSGRAGSSPAPGIAPTVRKGRLRPRRQAVELVCRCRATLV